MSAIKRLAVYGGLFGIALLMEHLGTPFLGALCLVMLTACVFVLDASHKRLLEATDAWKEATNAEKRALRYYKGGEAYYSEIRSIAEANGWEAEEV